VLSSFGTYTFRDEIIQSLFPEYTDAYSINLRLPADLLHKDSYNVFTLTIEDPLGKQSQVRLSKQDLLGIVAATNTKQRMRMMQLYYTAEKNNYGVCGTTNKTEYIQGFFVKYGDGGVDVEPLLHLYKTQIYQLAKKLGVNQEIIDRKPSPDTFSLEVTDEEFYFRIPFEKLDLLLYAWEHHVSLDIVCRVLGLEQDQVKRAFRDFTSKYSATKDHRMLPPSF
jgi:NAD+ synthase